MSAPVDVASVAAGPNGSQTRYGIDPLSPDQLGEKAVDKVAPVVTQRWKMGADELVKQRRDYWQNLSMFYGEQWVWWDTRRNMLQALPSSYSPLGKGRARTVANRVRPNLMSLLGRMMRNDLEFDVIPSDAGDDVVAGAMLAEDVLAAAHKDQDWRSVRYGENFAKFVGGTSAVCVEWDQSKGTQLAVSPATQNVIGTGEVVLEALSINEFCVQPGVRDARFAKWWIRGIGLAPDVVKEQYGLDWLPKADASMMMSPLQHKLLEHQGRGQGTQHLVLVLTMYERPNKQNPNGLVATVVNGRTVNTATSWPFPDKKRLNLFVFHQQQVDSSWVGTTLMNDAVPLQVQYNFMRSCIQEHAKKVGNARLMASMGSFLEEDLSDDPGAVLFYTPDVGGAVPQYLRPPDLPRWMVGEAADLKSEMDDVMFVHATSRGEASFDRASGQALALLSEKDDSPLGLMAFEESQQWAEIAGFVLRLYETKVSETRKVSVTPRVGQPGIVRAAQWSGKRLKGQTRVVVPLETTLPVSQAAMQAFTKDLWDRGIVKDPLVYARMLRLPQREVTDVLDADVARAIRENTHMAQGEVAFPEMFDDHGKHIAEHNRFRKSDSYAYANDSIRQVVDDHIKYHEHMAAEQAGGQVRRAMENPMLAHLPQADEPPGSGVPQDFAEQQGQLPPSPPSGGGIPAMPMPGGDQGGGAPPMPGGPPGAAPGGPTAPPTAGSPAIAAGMGGQQ